MDKDFNELKNDLRQAIFKNKEAVDKLEKYEKRGWEDRIEGQMEETRQTRARLYKAWDAYREALMDEE